MLNYGHTELRPMRRTQLPMTARRSSSRFASAGLLALLLAAVLSGCGGGSGSSGATPMAAASQGGGSGGSTTSSGSGGGIASNSGTSGSTGSATLSWQAPDTNIDGTALTNLAGYYIHYGTHRGNLDQLIKIGTVGLSTYVIDNLASGTYYFAISSYSTARVESTLSAIVSKTI